MKQLNRPLLVALLTIGISTSAATAEPGGQRPGFPGPGHGFENPIGGDPDSDFPPSEDPGDDDDGDEGDDIGDAIGFGEQFRDLASLLPEEPSKDSCAQAAALRGTAKFALRKEFLDDDAYDAIVDQVEELAPLEICAKFQKKADRGRRRNGNR